MGKILDSALDVVDGLFSWIDASLGQVSESYCQLETAQDKHVLVGKDGSLVSIIKLNGVTYLVGPEEYNRIHKGVTRALQTSMTRPGHAVQFYFQHDKESIKQEIAEILNGAKLTANRLKMKLDDLFKEREEHLSRYCASEVMYMVIWTTPAVMSKEQADASAKERAKKLKESKVQYPRNAQNFMAGIPELLNAHDSFLKATIADFDDLGWNLKLLDVHDACRAIRKSIDPDFTDENWQPSLPGDPLPVRETKHFRGDVSDLLWPPLAKQLIPRDGENIDLRTARIGDRIYTSIFIDLFPKENVPFVTLFNRVLHAKVPWRISFLIEGDGMRALGLKPVLAAILSFASNDNKLINGAMEVLNFYKNNTDEALVKLQVTATTWAKVGEVAKLRTRVAELAKAIQGWGYTETSEISGDSFGGVLGSALGINLMNPAIPAVAPLSDVTYMLPLTRPASPWTQGAVLFRSPDGKPWPYQPGSTLQTTWIDLVYARPGSGKSVLSNSMNLALCLSPGIRRLPRIAVIDIGPSSSGLISLIQAALPKDQKHLAAYHRLRMVKTMSINPFDTQLGCRFPTPQERAFLVNFLTLLATPVGESRAYDGVSDMAGLIVDEMYKSFKDDGKPHLYTENLEPSIDEKIRELNIALDTHTTWWEITDELFKAEETHLANVAQRYAMPLLADAASICRSQAVEDLYGSIQAPTGETLINAFGRMISSAVREYPILSQVTTFDLGEARIVSLDLDEVAKTGGEAADRQTAVMYMLARYVLARHFYLTEENVNEMPDLYKDYHTKRIREIREDPKRIVLDEFHRTSKAQAVRDQVIVDMREGRKWKVQVSLLSQSLDDFDDVMIEFATAVFIMDAGPKQAIEKSTEIFGLTDTARLALENRVHGPRAGGATFLAQFATKAGINTQLITSTIGPIELWAFNTTAEDVRIRNALYAKIGAAQTRRVLAMLYPSGSAAKVVEERLSQVKAGGELIDKEKTNSVIDDLIEEIFEVYEKNPSLAEE